MRCDAYESQSLVGSCMFFPKVNHVGMTDCAARHV